jgi:hypothetical protein
VCSVNVADHKHVILSPGFDVLERCEIGVENNAVSKAKPRPRTTQRLGMIGADLEDKVRGLHPILPLVRIHEFNNPSVAFGGCMTF